MRIACSTRTAQTSLACFILELITSKPFAPNPWIILNSINLTHH